MFTRFSFNLNRLACAGALALLASTSHAHIGVVNLTLPLGAPGQAAYGVANQTNEIQFVVPHGCTSAESLPAFSGANLDTNKIQITVPAAIVTATTAASLRPSLSGEFGAVTRSAVDASGNITFTWTKQLAAAGQQNFSAADDQLYKVSIRLKFPNVSAASDVSIKKYQFRAVQTCTGSGVDYVMDWGTANSPTIIVFPDRRNGFNKFTVDASALSDVTTTGTGTLASRLKSWFADAQIVWFGKSGYSPNPNTASKIQALIAKDPAYTELGSRAGVSLTASDVIWVKY